MKTTPSRAFKTILGLLLFGSFAQSAFADTVYLNDTFSDNDYQTQNLPQSARWFGSFNNLSTVEITPGSGNYALKNAPTSGTVRHAIAYFAPADAPITLGTSGDKLEFSFDITPISKNPNDALNVLRIITAHSGSSRITEENTNPQLALDGGYGFFINPALQRANIYGRTAASDVLLSALSNPGGWRSSDSSLATGGLLLNDTPDGAFAMVKDTTYHISIVFERLINGDLSVSYITSDGTNTTTSTLIDSVYKNYSFDTIGFAWGDAFGDGLIDNVRVSASIAIPESSAGALVIGVAAIVTLLYRVRRR